MCGFNGCEKPIKSRGYCTGHYNQLSKGKELTVLGSSISKTIECSFDGCKNKPSGKWCAAHAWQLRKFGKDGLKPVKNRKPNGAGTINKDGYIRIYKPEHPNSSPHGTILEHRYVMSEILGRPLLDSEDVHHKNGSRQDNRPENLELWIRSQPRGQRVEDLLDWAHQIIKMYEQE